MSKQPLSIVDGDSGVDQPGRVRVPQIVEPKTAGSVPRYLVHRLWLRSVDRRLIGASLVVPGRSVPLRPFLDYVAQQASSYERRSPYPTPPSTSTQRPTGRAQQGERMFLDAERAMPVEDGSYRWRGELRLWDNEALMGWYRSTDAAVRSKGTMYLALHPHGTHAWGRWVGMSYDGLVMTGWGAIARDEDEATNVVQLLVDTGGESRGRDR